MSINERVFVVYSSCFKAVIPYPFDWFELCVNMEQRLYLEIILIVGLIHLNFWLCRVHSEQFNFKDLSGTGVKMKTEGWMRFLILSSVHRLSDQRWEDWLPPELERSAPEDFRTRPLHGRGGDRRSGQQLSPRDDCADPESGKRKR